MKNDRILLEVALGACARQYDLTEVISRDFYRVTQKGEMITIGCQSHSIERWESFTPRQLSAMDTYANEWYEEHIHEVLYDAEEEKLPSPPPCESLYVYTPPVAPRRCHSKKGRKSGMLRKRDFERQSIYAPIYYKYTARQQKIMRFLCGVAGYPYGHTAEDWKLIAQLLH